jgi:hypothetical protein
MKIRYVQSTIRKATLELIETADQIVTDYMARGLILTLRQLYYQFVARGKLANVDTNYDRLGHAVKIGRQNGLIDWEGIEDRTRALEKNTHWDNPEAIIAACARSYQVDKWAGMERMPEVWIEKEALAGVLEGPCGALDVPYFACRGYPSDSEMWRAGRRFRWYRQDGREPIILHFGDHDPSGIDMTRDIRERVSLYARFSVEVDRIALNMDQIETYAPPPNPAKVTDSRYESYLAEFGDESWELDALDPETLADLVRDSVLEHRDNDIWNENLEREEREGALLQKTSDHWNKVIDFLDDLEENQDNEDDDEYDDD